MNKHQASDLKTRETNMCELEQNRVQICSTYSIVILLYAFASFTVAVFCSLFRPVFVLF